MPIAASAPAENSVVFQRFAAYLKNGRLAHAYLFAGPDDAGKTTTAMGIAKLANCEQNSDQDQAGYCGQCSSCQKIDSGNHPDVLVVESAEETSIKIARIREVISRIQMRPYEGRWKVVIIKNADEMTIEGGNALLKTLEEPTKDSLLILTSALPERLPGTVRSRCHTMRFFSLPRGVVKEFLEKDMEIDQGASHFFGYFSEGCLGRAKRLAENDFYAAKNEMIDQMIYRRDNDDFIKALSKNKEEVKRVLDVLLYWFRDILLLKSGVPQEHLTHCDRLQELHEQEKKYTFEQIEEIIEAIVDTLRLLDENLNVRIPLVLVKEKIWAK